jgi:CRP/FNR family cyclic AMP-dependent transcriptional regulator
MNAVNETKMPSPSANNLNEAARSMLGDLILGLPIFQDLKPGEIDVLSRHVRLYCVDQGSVIFKEGEEGTFMGLIIEGSAELSKQNAAQSFVRIGAEGAGRMLGEMALLDGEPRSATAKFVKTGKILMLSKESFQVILTDHPALGVSILSRLCQLLSKRLRRTTGLLSDHLSNKAPSQ